MLVAWVVFPVVLTALALGWGLLAERAAGRELPRALLPGLGLAAMVVVAGWLTASDPTAELTVPVITAGGVAGLAWLALPRLRGWRPDGWLVAAPLAVFAVYAAPIVLSGEATFAGYIKLDDTATWLTLTDRVMEHGRDLGGLAPSTYEATLAFNLGDGYPVGVFLPFGVGSALVGQDGLWVIQPYMAWLAAILSLSLLSLAGGLLDSRPARAAAAFIGAQPALLFGYYLWGGIKELAAAGLIAVAAALGGEAVRRGEFEWRALLPLAIAFAALVAVLTAGGAVWLLPVLVGVLVLAAGRVGWDRVLPVAAYFVATVAIVSLPLALGEAFLPPTSSPLDSESAQGNLFEPLNYLQAAGIWPVGDFRVRPEAPLLTYLACTVLIAAAGYAVWRAWRKAVPLVLYGAAALGGLVVLVLAGSPWVEGKALATASPAFLLLGAVGALAMARSGRRWEGGVALGVIAAGVLVSTVLAYSEVILAPRDQLAELEEVGEEIGGEGPTLITEYQPYGARHFLRDADPEAISELRRRRVALAEGELVPRGRTADTDQLALHSVVQYRTLVVRRSPAQSRPPAPYELTREGDFYEVWQRPQGSEDDVIDHLPLGEGPIAYGTDVRTTRTGSPDCDDVRDLARQAGPGEVLVAAEAAEPVVAAAVPGDSPDEWRRTDQPPGTLFLEGDATWEAQVDVPEPGDYGIWLAGSARGRIEASVDGEPIGDAEHHFNNSGEFIPLGSAEFEQGPNVVQLSYSAGRLGPGSRGRISPAGPLVLGRSAAESSLRTVRAERAETLCGGEWDWIELVRRA